jgi:hypothetical protein
MNMDTLYLAGAIAIAVAAVVYVVLLQYRAYGSRKKAAVIKSAIADYFSKSGVDVTVDSVRVPDTNRFTVFIESEPMKRFRLSHIIELSLRDMVHNLHALELDKVYWRFPIKKGAPGAAGDTEKQANADDYMTEGLAYRHLPKSEVSEASWETFEQASTAGPKQIDGNG